MPFRSLEVGVADTGCRLGAVGRQGALARRAVCQEVDVLARQLVGLENRPHHGPTSLFCFAAGDLANTSRPRDLAPRSLNTHLRPLL